MNLKAAKEEFSQYIREGVDVAKFQAKSFCLALALLMLFYVGSVLIPPGIVTYLITFPAALVCALTSLARVNDIGVEKTSKRWQMRRIGLILAGAGSVMLMASYWISDLVIPWRTAVLAWGVAFAWLTTPEMPPWEDYISGAYREKDYRVLKNWLGHRRNTSVAPIGVPVVEVTNVPTPSEPPDDEHSRRGDGGGP